MTGVLIKWLVLCGAGQDPEVPEGWCSSIKPTVVKLKLFSVLFFQWMLVFYCAHSQVCVLIELCFYAAGMLLGILEIHSMWLVYLKGSQRRTLKGTFPRRERCFILSLFSMFFYPGSASHGIYALLCAFHVRVQFCIYASGSVPPFQVASCFLVVEPRSRISRGFAFVTMDSNEDAERCIKHLNQSVLEGRYITVERVI